MFAIKWGFCRKCSYLRWGFAGNICNKVGFAGNICNKVGLREMFAIGRGFAVNVRIKLGFHGKYSHYDVAKRVHLIKF